MNEYLRQELITDTHLGTVTKAMLRVLEVFWGQQWVLVTCAAPWCGVGESHHTSLCLQEQSCMEPPVSPRQFSIFWKSHVQLEEELVEGKVCETNVGAPTKPKYNWSFQEMSCYKGLSAPLPHPTQATRKVSVLEVVMCMKTNVIILRVTYDF